MENGFFKNLRWLALLGTALLSSNASATLIFSEIEITSSSVSFTVHGNMTGYAEPSHKAQLSIQYLGGLWAGLPGYSANTWSASAFDSHTIDHAGNTGTWGSDTPYSWSSYYDRSLYHNRSLFNAIAINNRVTLWMGRDYLNPAAEDGALRFVWGNGHSLSTHRTLYTQTFGSPGFRTLASGFDNDVATVPEPSTVALLGLGLIGLGIARRRRVH